MWFVNIQIRKGKKLNQYYKISPLLLNKIDRRFINMVPDLFFIKQNKDT